MKPYQVSKTKSFKFCDYPNVPVAIVAKLSGTDRAILSINDDVIIYIKEKDVEGFCKEFYELIMKYRYTKS